MHEQRIGSELGMLSNLLKRQMACQPQDKEDSHVTGMQGMIIHYLAVADGDRFQKDVETQFRFRRSTATGILQLMEQHGLLRREPVPQDGRLKRLVLTDKALALHARVMQKLRTTEELMREGISEEDMDTWFRVCGKIRSNLENYQCRSSEETL
ncbi:MAG TPA: MarR family transcriptional regulator [Candidatus Agathobaculum stercoravium]|nr:MarR family transcriptional regulator [Candidatus Agathobaculum stercoravium]